MIARFPDRTGHRGPLTSAIIAWARDEATRATPITWARRPTVCQVSRPDRARAGHALINHPKIAMVSLTARLHVRNCDQIISPSLTA